jgi:hypothetical protein
MVFIQVDAGARNASIAIEYGHGASDRYRVEA